MTRSETRRAAKEAARTEGYHPSFNPKSIKSAPFQPKPPVRGYDENGNPNPRGKLTPDELHARAVARRDRARAIAVALGDLLGRIELHRPPHHSRGTPARLHKNRERIEAKRHSLVAPTVTRLSMVSL